MTEMKSPDSPNFEEFFRAIFPRAVRAAYRITGDRGLAEDAAIQAMSRAHFHWRRVGTLPWRDGWVLKTTFREALHLAWQPPIDSPNEELDVADMVVLRSALVDALNRLPKRQREAVGLRYLVDLPDAEVARAMAISLTSVKTHLHRGLRRLRLQSQDLA
jgi:DNA-directed RNA polymerase specialized sigma24 family protein